MWLSDMDSQSVTWTLLKADERRLWAVSRELPTANSRNPLVSLCHHRLGHQPKGWRPGSPDSPQATFSFRTRAPIPDYGSDTSPLCTTDCMKLEFLVSVLCTEYGKTDKKESLWSLFETVAIQQVRVYSSSDKEFQTVGPDTAKAELAKNGSAVFVSLASGRSRRCWVQ